MKKNVFTRVMSIVLTIVPLISIAQTVHNVTVGPGMTYTPASLSISVGDIVSWTSLGGWHDVNFAVIQPTGESFNNPAEVVSLPSQGAGKWDQLLLMFLEHIIMIVLLALMLQWVWLVLYQ